MPKENKTAKKSANNRNPSSSAHYERSNDNPNRKNIPSPSSDYAGLIEEATIGKEGTLKRAKNENFAANLPLIGPFIKADQANRYLEDYYRNTGMLPKYPAINTPGNPGGYAASAINSLVGSAAKIAPGTNDLYQFYAGEPDNFRMLMNNSYM